MKKILSILAISLLLTSCFGKTEEVKTTNDTDGNIKIEISDTTDSWEDVKVEIGEDGVSVDATGASIDIDVTDVKVNIDGEGKGATETPTDGETEEVIEDFENDINELFDMIENDEI